METSSVKSVVIQRAFYNLLVKEKLVDKTDFHQISKMCPSTRHHIKNALENGCTATKETYDAIMQFYSEKKKATDEQKLIVKNKDFASQI